MLDMRDEMTRTIILRKRNRWKYLKYANQSKPYNKSTTIVFGKSIRFHI